MGSGSIPRFTSQLSRSYLGWRSIVSFDYVVKIYFCFIYWDNGLDWCAGADCSPIVKPRFVVEMLIILNFAHRRRIVYRIVNCFPLKASTNVIPDRNAYIRHRSLTISSTFIYMGATFTRHTLAPLPSYIYLYGAAVTCWKIQKKNQYSKHFLC